MTDVLLLDTQANNIDIQELQSQLSALKFSYFFSDFGFCPFIIAFYSTETNKPEISNINTGFLSTVKKQSFITEFTSSEEFISSLLLLRDNKFTSNTLF